MNYESEEDLRFPRKKNINRMTSSDSDISKYNSCDGEFDADTIDQILQELIIEEDIEVDSAEEIAIKRGT